LIIINKILNGNKMNDNIDLIRQFTMTSKERCENIVKLVESVNAQKISGDLVECGVWKCGILGLMCLTDDKYGGKRKVIGFDSFKYEPDHITIEKAKENLKSIGAERCTLIKGYFNDTFPKTRKKITKISILRIDAGLYDVTQQCLNEFYDKVSVGGYIVIDDYGHYKECKQAVDDFRNSRNINDQLNHTDYTEVWWKKTS